MTDSVLLLVIALVAILAALVLGVGDGVLHLPVLPPLQHCVRSPYTNYRYCLTPEGLTWVQAENYARSHGGYLVSVGSQAEQDWLVQQFGGTRLFWVGFTDRVVESVWGWTNGNPVTYTNWAAGEPNDANHNEDYAVMNWSSSGKWNDLGPDSVGWDDARIGIVEIH